MHTAATEYKHSFTIFLIVLQFIISLSQEVLCILVLVEHLLCITTFLHPSHSVSSEDSDQSRFYAGLHMTIPSFLLISAKFTAHTNSFSAGISCNENLNIPCNFFLLSVSPQGKALPPPHTLPSLTRLVSFLSSSPSPPHPLLLPGNQFAFKLFRSRVVKKS